MALERVKERERKSFLTRLLIEIDIVVEKRNAINLFVDQIVRQTCQREKRVRSVRFQVVSLVLMMMMINSVVVVCYSKCSRHGAVGIVCTDWFKTELFRRSAKRIDENTNICLHLIFIIETMWMIKTINSEDSLERRVRKWDERSRTRSTSRSTHERETFCWKIALRLRRCSQLIACVACSCARVITTGIKPVVVVAFNVIIFIRLISDQLESPERSYLDEQWFDLFANGDWKRRRMIERNNACERERRSYDGTSDNRG